jgi:hypothetical protein
MRKISLGRDHFVNERLMLRGTRITIVTVCSSVRFYPSELRVDEEYGMGDPLSHPSGL